jgi:hypothetical protein
LTKKWIPIVAGFLDILSSIYVIGLFLWWGWIVLVVFPIPTVLGVFTALIAFVGGIYAIRRKEWPIALVGSFAAVITCITVVMIHNFAAPHYYVPIVWFVIGWAVVAVVFPTVILTMISKKQFGEKVELAKQEK